MILLDVIDTYSNELINLNGPYVVVDDTIADVKKRLFTLNDFESEDNEGDLDYGVSIYYPNLLKIEVGEDENRRVLQGNKPIMYYLDISDIQNNVKLYVTNLVAALEDPKYNTLELFTKIGSEEFERFVEELVQDGYVDAKNEDVVFALQNIIKTNFENYEYLTDKTDTYILSLINTRNVVLKNIQNDTRLQQKYASYLNLNGREYKNNVGDFVYTDIIFVVKGNNYQSGSKGRFINIQNVFNGLQLSDTIPFAAITIGDKPLVKLRDNLSDTVDPKDIKSWIVTEKKKQKITTYKKIKGLLLKYKSNVDASGYTTVNVMDTGLIYIKMTFLDTSNIKDVQDLEKEVKVIVDTISSSVNSLHNAFFSKQTTMSNASMSSVAMVSFSGFVETNVFLDLEDVVSITSFDYIKNSLFELKGVNVEESVSILYKKLGDVDEEESRGLTINIKNNPYKGNSSIVTVYGAINFLQPVVIVEHLVLLLNPKRDAVDDNDTQGKKRGKSNTKRIREAGGEIYSVNCQGEERQPKLWTEWSNENKDAASKLDAKNILEFKDIKYACVAQKYPYPGFTNENIVCCFKKPQLNKEKYKRNMKEHDAILYRPSNMEINVQDTHGTYTTFAIKIASDYGEGFNETNSIGRYFYLDIHNELVSITNPNLISRLNEEQDGVGGIWLDSVTLDVLLAKTDDSKCMYKPDLSKKSVEDVNAPCKHHKKNQVFGYKTDSYPCCFIKKPIVKGKEIDLMKVYIYTSDKVLEHKRIGHLPSELDVLLNGESDQSEKHTTDGRFYRMGVFQSASSFLTAVLLANEFVIESLGGKLDNVNMLRVALSQYLTNNQDVYAELNSGALLLKYKLSVFNKKLLDTNASTTWNDFLDLMARVTRCNIIILDIPYIKTQSTIDPDYTRINILCNNVKQETGLDTIVLLKRRKAYEIIINKTSQNIQYKFGSNERIVRVLMDYQKASCVSEEKYPDTFNWSKLYTVDDIVTLLKGTKHEILAQFANVYRKVDYVVTKSKVIIPVKEESLRKNKLNITSTLSSMRKSDQLLSIEKYTKRIENVNQILIEKGGVPIEIVGVSVDKNNMIDAVMTKFGQFVPLKLSQMGVGNVVLPYKYYEDINQILLSNIESSNEQVVFSNSITKQKEELHKLKQELGPLFTEVDRKEIMGVVRNPRYTRIEKVSKIKENLKNLRSLSSDTDEFWYDVIALEIISDNIDNMLINNVVLSDDYNTNAVVVHDAESILSDISDVSTWVTKMQRED
jgi:hypothetical protein